MVHDIDIWRTARMLISEYGDEAVREASRRADALEDSGDPTNAEIWRLVRRAVTKLQGWAPSGRLN